MNIFVNKPDFVGMAASILCAIHCAAFPLLFAAQPLVHEAISSAEGHGHGHGHGHGGLASLWSSLDFVFLALSLVAVYFAARASRNATTKVWLWTGWAIFAIGVGMEQFGLPGWLMYVGSAVLVIAHLINFRQCKIPSRPAA